MSLTQTNPSSHLRRIQPVHWLGLLLSAAALLTAALLWAKRITVESTEVSQRRATLAKGRVVSVMRVEVSDAAHTISLPGEVRAFLQATVYARVSGYLKSIRTEIGERVKANELIGVIDSPEAEQQAISAQADVAVKKQTVNRFAPLVDRGIVSKQQMEQAEADLKVAEATLAQALVRRGNQQIRAPFAGAITARYVDPGALIPAPTTSTQGSLPLVDVAEVDRVRVIVQLGQHDANVHIGDEVELWTDEQPESIIAASITHIAQALDPQTRTMTAHVVLDNRTYKLLPGTFVHARVRTQRARRPTIPMSALIIRNGETSVGVVKEGRVQITPVKIGEQDGANAQILSGLRGGEVVALNLGSQVENNSRVRPVFVKPSTKR